MRVAWLKWRLRCKYIRWNDILDEYPCGMHIARTISPRLSDLEHGMNKLLKKLKALGEDVPKMPWEETCG